jgi:transposase
MKIKPVPRNPGKRPKNAPQPDTTPRGRGRLFVEPATIRDQADQLGALAPRIGGPLATMTSKARDAQEEAVVVTIDPVVGHVAEVVQKDLLRYEEVEKTAGVDRTRHAALADQVAASQEAYVNAARRDQSIEDSLRAVGHANRKLRADLKQAIPLALSQGLVPAGQEAALRSALTGLQAEEAKLQNKKQAARAEATRDTQKAQAAKERSSRREDLLETMLALKERRKVDPVQAAEALRTYAAVAGEQEAAADAALTEEAERRDRSR